MVRGFLGYDLRAYSYLKSPIINAIVISLIAVSWLFLLSYSLHFTFSSTILSSVAGLSAIYGIVIKPSRNLHETRKFEGAYFDAAYIYMGLLLIPIIYIMKLVLPFAIEQSILFAKTLLNLLYPEVLKDLIISTGLVQIYLFYIVLPVMIFKIFTSSDILDDLMAPFSASVTIFFSLIFGFVNKLASALKYLFTKISAAISDALNISNTPFRAFLSDISTNFSAATTSLYNFLNDQILKFSNVFFNYDKKFAEKHSSTILITICLAVFLVSISPLVAQVFNNLILFSNIATVKILAATNDIFFIVPATLKFSLLVLNFTFGYFFTVAYTIVRALSQVLMITGRALDWFLGICGRNLWADILSYQFSTIKPADVLGVVSGVLMTRVTVSDYKLKDDYINEILEEKPVSASSN